MVKKFKDIGKKERIKINSQEEWNHLVVELNKQEANGIQLILSILRVIDLAKWNLSTNCKISTSV